MYYLFCENEALIILLKSKNIQELIKVVSERNLKGWSINDVPVDYEEFEYIEV